MLQQDIAFARFGANRPTRNDSSGTSAALSQLSVRPQSNRSDSAVQDKLPHWGSLPHARFDWQRLFELITGLVFLQSPIQRLAINAQDASCFGTVSVDGIQDVANVTLFDSFQRLKFSGIQRIDRHS